MHNLTARDALTEQLQHVTEDQRPLTNASRNDGALVYAVFAAAGHNGSPDLAAFRGLVTDRDVARQPARIFGDLIPRPPVAPLAATTPLRDVLGRLEQEHLSTLPVLDADGIFLGAVTSTSIYSALLARAGGEPAAALGTEIERDHQRLTARAGRLGELHDASLRLMSLLALHEVEEEMLHKAIVTLAELIGARYGAIGLVDEAGQLQKFVHSGIGEDQARRIGSLPQGKGLLGVVIHKNQTLRLDDMSKDPRSAGFPKHHPPMKSLLAVPVSLEGRVFGRVYLSDKHDASPFSEDDEHLTRDFADALAFTLSYHRDRAERQRAEENLRQVAQALSGTTGHAFFQSLVTNLCQVLGVDFAFVGELEPGDHSSVRTVAVSAHGRMVDNFSYALAGTPCENVIGHQLCYFPDKIQQQFPSDRMLVDMGIESYMGTPLFGSGGRPLGLLAVMHGQRLPQHSNAESILKISAARAAAELERMIAEEALRKSEHKYRYVLEHIDEIVYSISFPDSDPLAGTVDFVSPRVEAIIGWPAREFIDDPDLWGSIMHPEDQAGVAAATRRQAENGKPVLREYRLRHKITGDYRWMEDKVVPRYDRSGRLVGQDGVARDITERKQAEHELRDQAAHIRALLDAVPDLLFRIRADGTYLDFKPARDFPSLIPPQDFIGKNTVDLLPPEVAAESLRLIRLALDSGEVQTHQYRLTLDGQPRDYEARIAPCGTDEVLGMVRDVTERHQNEQRIRQLAGALEQTADAVIITDRDGLIQYVNPAYAQVTGYSADEAIGHKPSLVKSGVHDAGFYRQLWETIRRGEVYREVLVNRRKDGSTYYEEKTITPLKDEHGHISHYVSTGKDISQRMQEQQQLRDSEERFRQLTDNITEVFWMTSVDKGQMLYVSPAFEQIWGRPREDLYAAPRLWLEAIHPDDQARVMEADTAFHRQESDEYNTEYRIRRPDGSQRWILDRAFPIRDAKGQVYRIAGIAKDITERKNTEARQLEQEERLRATFEQAAVGIAHVATDGRFLRANRKFCEIVGYSEAELTTLTLQDITHPDDQEPDQAQSQRLRDREISQYSIEKRYRHRNGSPVWVNQTGSAVRHPDGTPKYYIAVVEDISARKTADDTIARLGRILDESSNEIYVFDAQTLHFTQANHGTTRNLGYSEDELRRMTPLDLKPEYTLERFETLLAPLRSGASELVAFETTHQRKDGSLYPVELRLHYSPHEQPPVFVVIGQDITERKQAEQRLSYLAYYDVLTGLPNRQQFIERLRQSMHKAQQLNRLVAVVFLDLDRFKLINDTLGHDIGDALLKSVAERLTTSVRPGDTVARLSGDEFTIALDSVAHVDDITRVAQKILDRFAQPFRLAGRELFISPSIGITLFPLDDNTVEGLLKNADAAMYHAKEHGRNNFQFYTAELNERAQRRLMLETALRRALPNNELQLHYQPQLDLRSGRITGMEALIRWQSPEHGMISPVDFIPLAEDTGLIISIGEWVLRQACLQARTWQEAGLGPLQVAVNLSTRQFLEGRLDETVRQVLEETGLAPEFLDLELTESMLMRETDQVAETMRKLDELGVEFSMDDFGTGYSSLAYLKRFPFSTIKIDRSFVKDVTDDPEDAAIAQAIIAMAHSLEMRVIAEGVETGEQLEFLRGHDCDAMQGYHFSRPLPAVAFAELLAGHRPERRKTARPTKAVKPAAAAKKRVVRARRKPAARPRRR